MSVITLYQRRNMRGFVTSRAPTSWIPAEKLAVPPWEPSHVQTKAIHQSGPGTDDERSWNLGDHSYGNQSNQSSRDPADAKLVV